MELLGAKARFASAIMLVLICGLTILVRVIFRHCTGQCVPLLEGARADVIVTFNSPRALPGGLAFWLEVGGGSPTPMSCFDKVPSEPQVWHGVPSGDHRIRAVLWKAPSGSSAQPKSKEELEGTGPFEVARSESVELVVHRFEDFNPSYEFRKVEPWHRLPEGLEISVNLQEGGSQARIPQPWQWDVRVVGQEARQRVPVRAETTMSDILEVLGLSDSTHEVVWCQDSGKHERVLQPGWTALQADLFRYQNQVFVRRFATMVD
ncbi:unnamed protein product [Symbiodinium natans]|uniref:Uncharacterized protein n=1 Tax=Symbiodinium natans TaxID=878477 RepID=A0A812JE45_9DINO|nr:unnamed protein product [Symbiodinium natans]